MSPHMPQIECLTQAARCSPDLKNKLDLAFNNVKPKDWYFVLD